MVRTPALPPAVLSGLHRAGRLTAQGLVLTAVVGGTVLYSQFDQQVTLVVDGHHESVRGHAGTVAALLSDEGIAVDSHDLVAPAPGAALKDGDTVVVRYGRQLTVTVDGRTRVLWTTETTVDRALAVLGIRAEGAVLSASRSTTIERAGLKLSVSTPKRVRIRADHATHQVTSSALTVETALAEAGVTLGGDDKVSVLTSAPLVDGMTIVVTRIEHQTQVLREKYSAKVVHRKASSRYVGTSAVVRPGHTGRRLNVYEVVRADGKVVGRHLTHSTVVAKAQARIVEVGTKARPKAKAKTDYSSNVGGSVDSLNWAALAKCESGGNPKAVNPSGYYGLYQFSLSTWRSVGGSGNPINASSSEQTMRAKKLYLRSGASQWTCGSRLFS